MERLKTILKDWCLNQYEFSIDIQDESLQMVEELFSENHQLHDLEMMSKKVALLMENWINNINNQRLDIELMVIAEQEEALDKFISSYL